MNFELPNYIQYVQCTQEENTGWNGYLNNVGFTNLMYLTVNKHCAHSCIMLENIDQDSEHVNRLCNIK